MQTYSIDPNYRVVNIHRVSTISDFERASSGVISKLKVLTLFVCLIVSGSYIFNSSFDFDEV